jgi:hypothetical protein
MRIEKLGRVIMEKRIYEEKEGDARRRSKKGDGGYGKYDN